MSATAVGHCSQCAAVVNRHWPRCLVCHAPLIAAPSRESGSPASTAPPHPRVKAVTRETSPTSPLQPGWLVVYRDRQGRLAGGCDDREHGTVAECRWIAGAWTVHLTDGQQLSLSRIRSVAAVDCKGLLYEAWTVAEHGYDGAKQNHKEEQRP